MTQIKDSVSLFFWGVPARRRNQNLPNLKQTFFNISIYMQINILHKYKAKK
jgi:hypothetical protein